MPGFLLTWMELPGQVALLALPTALLASGKRLSLGPSCSPFYYLLHEVGIRRRGPGSSSRDGVKARSLSPHSGSIQTLSRSPSPTVSCLKLKDPSLFALTGVAALCHGAVTQFKSARPRRVWGFVELGTGPDIEWEPS